MASVLDSALTARLAHASPKIQAWILDYVAATTSEGATVASLAIPGLSKCYSQQLLDSTRVVIVDEVPYPPLADFGLHEFHPLQEVNWSGITFNDVYFLRRDVLCPALHFHELVHVVQYRRLGVERFLWAYGVGLALYRYEESPLEKMAYNLQLEFENGIYRRSLVTDIERQTDAIYSRVLEEAGESFSPV